MGWRGVLTGLFVLASGCVYPVKYTAFNDIARERLSHSVPRGASVRVRLTSAIRSSNTSAQLAQFVVLQNVRTRSDRVVIEAGAPVHAEVIAVAGRSVGRPGTFDVIIRGTVDVAGDYVPLSGRQHFEGEGRAGRSGGLTAGMFFLMGPFSFAFLSIKGGDARIPAGHVFTARTTRGVAAPPSRRTTSGAAKSPAMPPPATSSARPPAAKSPVTGSSEAREVRFRSGCVVRAEPARGAKKVGVAKAGERYRVIHRIRVWRAIQLSPDVQGWVRCKPMERSPAQRD